MYKAMTVDFLVEPATFEEMRESTEVNPPIWTETLEKEETGQLVLDQTVT